MFKQKEKKESIPAIVLRNIDFPQVIADTLPVKLPELPTLPVLKKSENEEKPDIITRVLEYEHTPIIAAATVGFLAGVIVGFAVSPIKRGVRIGCNNKAVTNEYDEYDEDINDYEEDE